MTTYSVRCRNSTCRHRRVATVHPDDYKRPPKCPCCGSTKGWRIELRQYSKRDRCTCSGYPHPHQKASSKFCDHNPQGPYHQAKRHGASDDDIPLEYLGRKMKEDEPCPF